MYPASFEYSRADELGRGAFGPRALRRRGEDPRRRPEPHPSDEAALRLAARARRHERHRRVSTTLDEDNGMLRIGALVRHKTCERSELLRGRYGVLGEAAPQISDPIVRNRGTVARVAGARRSAGRLGLRAAGRRRARSVAQGPGGTRTIAIDDFFVGPFTTALEPNEIVTEVRVPIQARRAGGAYLKIERKVGDFATVAVGVHVTWANGTLRAGRDRPHGGGSEEHPRRRGRGGARRRRARRRGVRRGCPARRRGSEPRDDVRGSAEYKRNVVRVFTERGLRKAADAAGGRSPDRVRYRRGHPHASR